MRATSKAIVEKKITVDTVELQQILSTGRSKAVEIGTAAGARLKAGRLVLWNVKKIQEYIDSISERQEVKGYGEVSESIMRNQELTVEARGIYAYFCSIVGTDDSCYPSLDTVLHDLNITKQRFYKHLNLLIDAGIIEKAQEKTNGQFGKVVYRIKQMKEENEK